MWFSIVVSSGILVWAFTIPMRHSNEKVTELQSDVSEQTSTVARRSETPQDRAKQAEQYRAWAMELDRELMRMQRAKDQRHEPRSLPGDQEVRQHQENYRNWMLDEIKRLANAPKHSPEYEFRQQLIESLDAPQ
ncbi:hypothetical protein [Novipirellula maiorica]|nr:hypothetical protein [Rhodopirellula maiorica]